MTARAGTEVSRRELVAGAAAIAPLSAAARAFGEPLREKQGPKLGICDWCTGTSGPASLDVAKAIGLQGLQISPQGAADLLSYADPTVQAAYRAKCKETGVAVSSLALTLSNEFPIASDARAGKWIEQSINAAHDFGVKAILLAFFGNGDLTNGKDLKRPEIDAVVGRLKEAAPHAKKKGVVLGIESYLSADDLLRIMDRIGSPAVGVYYDIANTTVRGYDVPAEIRRLKGRICEFHFKDYKGPIGTSVALKEIVAAITEIRYRDWIVFENQSGPDLVGYFRGNAEIVRGLM